MPKFVLVKFAPNRLSEDQQDSFKNDLGKASRGKPSLQLLESDAYFPSCIVRCAHWKDIQSTPRFAEIVLHAEGPQKGGMVFRTTAMPGDFLVDIHTESTLSVVSASGQIQVQVAPPDLKAKIVQIAEKLHTVSSCQLDHEIFGSEKISFELIAYAINQPTYQSKRLTDAALRIIGADPLSSNADLLREDLAFLRDHMESLGHSALHENDDTPAPRFRGKLVETILDAAITFIEDKL